MKKYDIVVAGSGIAGLFAALKATQHGSVALVTKSVLDESNTRYAQGGIAAALADDDSAALHAADTINAGAGLCDHEAVDVLCSLGPSCINELLTLGVAFDKTGNQLQKGLEAAHSRARIIHAGGDATGAHIEHSLCDAIHSNDIDVYEHTFLIDLIVDDNRVLGVKLLNDTSFDLEADNVIIATGGAGQVFARTTNPAVATGDGIAAAFRAGAVIADSEFYQFHPTAIAVGQPFLISEAVRGEGAVLRNDNGDAFMKRYHQLGDLAPRDVVARSIATEMHTQDETPVMLDATALGARFLAERFPSIDRHLHTMGIDWSTQPIPVTPAAHYWMGGISTDTWGLSSIDHLYAIGEAACTGVHGANRLASNSLLEGLVFAHRAIEHIHNQGHREHIALTLHRLEPEAGNRRPDVMAINDVMWHDVGLERNASGLKVALKELANYSTDTNSDHTIQQLEAINLATVARLITTAALNRTESRGAHYRSDYPTSQNDWVKRVGFTC